ncbi:hypothetical protein BDV41DRAFT_541342 [Aspergillus transmontanensis]|uniref:Uncharacterized protein n=1 Tax=Aspergillus transmontanensis TaxID=1034304 RepID=A0A5N6VST8_9EURO|nr:hypothetical protein BDV41DRAFT_541342 [Aspergillus transmontanensis]
MYERDGVRKLGGWHIEPKQVVHSVGHRSLIRHGCCLDQAAECLESCGERLRS